MYKRNSDDCQILSVVRTASQSCCQLENESYKQSLALAGDRREKLSTHMYATYTSRGYYMRVALIRSELLTVQLKFQGGGYSRGSIYSKKYGMYLHYTEDPMLKVQPRSQTTPRFYLTVSDFPPQLQNKIWEWPGNKTTHYKSVQAQHHSQHHLNVVNYLWYIC